MGIIFDRINDDSQQAVDKLNSQFSPSALDPHKHDGTEGGGAKIDGANILNSVPKATNITGGGIGRIAFNTASDTTGFVSAGTSAQVLIGGNTPTWTNISTLVVASAATAGVAAVADMATKFGTVKLIKSGYLSAANYSDTITIGDVTIPINRQYICVVNPLSQLYHGGSNNSKTLKAIGVDMAADTAISMYGVFGTSPTKSAGTYTGLTVAVKHFIQKAFLYTDSSTDISVVNFPCFYQVLEIDI